MKKLTYNDWVEDKIPGIVEHGVKRGPNTYIDSASRERKYFKITDEEFDKINKKQKEIYDRLVNNQFKITNNTFEEKLDRSSNKERLLGKEIEYYQFLFFPEKEDFKYPKPHTNRTIGTHYLSQVRALYIKLIEKDEWDYSHIKYVDEKKSATNSGSEEKRLKEALKALKNPNPENVNGYHIHVEAVTKHLEWLEGLQETKSTTKGEKTKTFPEYLLHKNRISLAKKIKNEFKSDKGKIIRLLIEALTNSGLLTIGYGEKNAFYMALKEYFDSDIGSYNSIFYYPYNKVTNKSDLESINKRLESLLTSQ